MQDDYNDNAPCRACKHFMRIHYMQCPTLSNDGGQIILDTGFQKKLNKIKNILPN